MVTPSHTRRWVFVIFAFALVMRLPVVLAVLAEPGRAIISSDCQQYLGLARNLLAHGVFSLSDGPPFVPEIIRTPGYPVFLLSILSWCDGDCLVSIVALQALLGALIAPGVMLLGTRLIGERAGRLAGLLYAIAPTPAIMGGFAQTETLFSALLIAGTLVLVARRHIWAAVASGVILGIAVLTRPIGLLALPLFATYPLLDRHFREIWRRSAALLAGAALIVLPWMARNAYHYGVFKLSTISDGNLYYYNVAGTEARRRDIPIDEARSRLAEELSVWPGSDSQMPIVRAGEFARHLVWQHPLWFAWANGVDAINGFRPGFSFMFYLVGDNSNAEAFSQAMMRNDMGILSLQPLIILAVAAYMAVFQGLLLVLCVLGIISLLWKREWNGVLLLVAIPGWFLYMPGIASNARFFAPVVPLLCILASGGIVRLVLPFFDKLVAALKTKRRGQSPSSS